MKYDHNITRITNNGSMHATHIKLGYKTYIQMCILTYR